MVSNLKYWVGFNIVKGIGPAKVQALLEHFGSLADAWTAEPDALARLGFDKRSLTTFVETRTHLDLDGEMEKLDKRGVKAVCWDSADYPAYLRAIPNAPPTLYVQGALEERDRWGVAIVGTRRLTAYGRQLTREISAELANNGVTIVSGLARGIDSIAHQTALDCGGRTIAVLGSGLDCVYPTENRNLARAIADGRGALVSEYALGVQPERKNFPPRNRVISGLSLGVIVIEAGERSGALITANFAEEQGRDIYALPGNVTNHASKGTNKLIQRGAKLITCADDVLRDLNLEEAVAQQAVQMMLPDSAEEAALIPHLSRQPRHVDELSRVSGMASALVSSTLTLMELKGMVQQVGGMNYVMVREAGTEYKT